MRSFEALTPQTGHGLSAWSLSTMTLAAIGITSSYRISCAPMALTLKLFTRPGESYPVF